MLCKEYKYTKDQLEGLELWKKCMKDDDLWDEHRVWSEKAQVVTHQYLNRNMISPILMNFDRNKYKTIIVCDDDETGQLLIPIEPLDRHRTGYTVMSLEIKEYINNPLSFDCDDAYYKAQDFLIDKVAEHFNRLGYGAYLEHWLDYGVCERVEKILKSWYYVALNKAKRKLF